MNFKIKFNRLYSANVINDREKDDLNERIEMLVSWIRLEALGVLIWPWRRDARIQVWCLHLEG